MKKQHRSGSSSEDDVPLLEFRNRIKARNCRIKRENGESEISSSNSSSTGSSSSSPDSSDNNSDLENPKADRHSESRMEDNSDTESYFSTIDLDENSAIIRPEPEQMEVDKVKVRKHRKTTKKHKVKRLLDALSDLLK